MLRAIAGPDMVVLRTPVHMRGENMTTVGEFTVGEGDRVPFVLSYGPSHLPVPKAFAADAALKDTEEFWQEWTRKGHIHGRWSDAVCRSLITLKALTYEPTGGIVAAPTTSLPELIGGNRNWDYRYCWVRDATLTLLALMNAGYYEEAQAWRDWLTRAVAGRPEQMDVMYGVAGERRLTEWEVPWLPGYENSAPVRIGNAAHQQLAARRVRRGDGYAASEPARRPAIERVRMGRADRAARSSGRDLAQARSRHLGSAHRAAALHLFQGDGLGRVRSRDQERRDVRPAGPGRALARHCAPKFTRMSAPTAGTRKRNSFMRSYGSKDLDASLLLLAPIGFLKPDDPRFRGTVEAIERDLIVDGLVMRYDTRHAPDGLPAGEGAFLACSFWLADAYLLLGRREDAERLFERLVGARATMSAS